jgi:hypothetical protein
MRRKILLESFEILKTNLFGSTDGQNTPARRER